MNRERLKEVVAEILPGVDAVIAYGQGFDAAHGEPCFVTKKEEVEGLILNPLSEHNLASYLPSRKNKKTGVVVKGCDSRTIVQFLQEGLVKRENLVIIGVPCTGVVSAKKLARALDHQTVEDVRFEGETVIARTPRGEKRLALADVTPDKCRTCRYPTPLIYDVLVGEPIESDKDPAAVYDDVRELMGKSLEERKAYWEKEIGRCTRCYACRNACPLCVCQDSCIAETRDPHWVSQRSNLSEKMMFHFIHAIHLAGRCTECGECERACPMDIPLGKLKKKINMDMLDLFDYVPGIVCEDKPPLYTFKVEEKKIEEHEL
ncbi:MAG TPA: 4Fe-4S dicluster domain-containing protein [Syntrophorhabdales bacterium]|nr:4Fe-4S dicluster domain-containing protein [Syntrophorhabdales bacterium]